MPVSKLSPPKNVVSDFYHNRGQVRQGAAIDERIATQDRDAAQHQQTHRDALAGVMVAGGLCKSVKA